MADFIESEAMELKSTWSDSALKTVSAFSNENGGTIVVGVDDRGNVTGVENADNLCTAITSSISDNIRPNPIEYVSLEIRRVQGKDIICVRVFPGTNRPYYWKAKGLREGGVFIRRGTSSVAAPYDMILKMVRGAPEYSYERAPSLKQDLTFDYTGRVFAEFGIGLGATQMESVGMIGDGAYTNLAYMLSDQFSQGIKMAVYDDEFKGEFMDRDEAAGSVLSQFERAYGFVDRHNAKRSRIVGPRRLDSREYPEEAVREVIVNAIVHRDYGIRGDILISMFPDRMVVLSAGGLNAGIGLDDVMAGLSSRRNEMLAALLYRLKMVEAFGTGLLRIRGLYRNQPLKPKIEVTGNSFKVVLPKILAEPLPDAATEALALFEGRNEVRRRDLEESLGVSRNMAYRILGQLESAGLIERAGAGRDISYRLVVGH